MFFASNYVTISETRMKDTKGHLQVNEKKVEKAIKQLLLALGYNPSTGGLRKTPYRVAKFYKEWQTLTNLNWREFNATAYRNMVVIRGIPFFSMCEHHILPFFGQASIGYIPKDKVVGLSKLAWLIKFVTVGLHTQEEITHKVIEILQNKGIKDCIVVIEAVHTCMALRGVNTGFDTTVTTSAISGVFEQAPTREEFFSIIQRRPIFNK